MKIMKKRAAKIKNIKVALYIKDIDSSSIEAFFNDYTFVWLQKVFLDIFQWISCPESKDFTIFHCSFNNNGPPFERPENVDFLKIISQHLVHTWEGRGRVWGCQTRHKWVWGGYVTLFWKMLNQKALIKRFSFVVYMNIWAIIY